MTDHLNEARTFAECAQNWGSPDARSIPYALHGITHALIAIAEALNAAGTPRTAPRSDAEHAQAPDSGPKPAGPGESHQCDSSGSCRFHLPAGELGALQLGHRVCVGGWSGTLVEIHHDQDGTSLQWDDDGLPGGCRRGPDELVEVQW